MSRRGLSDVGGGAVGDSVGFLTRAVVKVRIGALVCRQACLTLLYLAWWS